jgi:hypothetical protein
MTRKKEASRGDAEIYMQLKEEAKLNVLILENLKKVKLV